MKRQQQHSFVVDLIANIKRELLDRLDCGHIPEEWDGHELRVWIAERFDDAASMSLIRRDGRSRRAREYRNVILTLP